MALALALALALVLQLDLNDMGEIVHSKPGCGAPSSFVHETKETMDALLAQVHERVFTAGG